MSIITDLNRPTTTFESTFIPARSTIHALFLVDHEIKFGLLFLLLLSQQNSPLLMANSPNKQYRNIMSSPEKPKILLIFLRKFYSEKHLTITAQKRPKIQFS